METTIVPNHFVPLIVTYKRRGKHPLAKLSSEIQITQQLNAFVIQRSLFYSILKHIASLQNRVYVYNCTIFLLVLLARSLC